MEEGQLSEWHFKNIVTTAIRLQAYNWVFDFMNRHKCLLPDDVRENAYSFNMASYYYAIGQYPQVLALLTQVSYTDLRYSLGARALLLRTYYDLQEYDALESLAGSFNQFLIRNKLMADERRQGYANLFRFTRRAARIRQGLAYNAPEKTLTDLTKLRKDMQQADDIFNKLWLDEKLSELEK